MSEKAEIIKRWIEKADHDLGTAITTYKNAPKYKDTIAFHCQQAVEKYLKSYIIKLDLELRRTHDLVYLLEQIKTKDTIDQDSFEKIYELQDFAIEIRYPDHMIELTNEEIESAILIAKEFRKLILKKLNPDTSYNDDEFRLDF